jgi:hypothetical protein
MNDPIHKRKDGWWYFWNKSETCLYGPFRSRKIAMQKLKEHREMMSAGKAEDEG